MLQKQKQILKGMSDAMSEPIMISKTGHETIVMISEKEYDRLETCEDAYWGIRALIAGKEGYLGEEKGKKLIDSLIR